jgi:hypothetical protein
VRPQPHTFPQAICRACGHREGKHYWHDGPDGPAPCPDRETVGRCPGHCIQCERAERGGK